MSLPQCCGEKIRNVVILKAQVSDVGVDGNPPGGRVKLVHNRA
jgi:hypothetical protein